MAISPSQTNFLSSPHASHNCHLEAPRSLVHYLLLPQLRLDHRRQRHHLHLADYNLQIYPLQSRYVDIPLPSPFISRAKPSPGFFYFAPIIGALIGAILGHWLHDLVGNYYLRRHGGHIEPEARLIIIWLASPIMAISILVLGFAIQHTYHYMVLAVFVAGQVTGIMIATVALNAYLLDAYPEGSGEVGAWINVGRTLGGFMATYMEIDWVEDEGPVKAFAAQTGGAVAAGLVILGLGIFGKRLRKRQGRMRFAMDGGY